MTATDDEFWLPTRAPHFAACLDHLSFEWWVEDRQLTIYCEEGEAHWIAACGTDINIDMAEGDGKGFVTAYQWLLDGGDIKEMERAAGGGDRVTAIAERDSWRADAERLIEEAKHATQRIMDEHEGAVAALALAERRAGEIAALRGLMNEWEHQGSTRDVGYRDDLCDRWLAALTGVPPDAPKGDGDASR